MFIWLVGNVSDKQIFCNLMTETVCCVAQFSLPYLLVGRCENVLHITCTYCDAIGMEISCDA